LNVLSWTGSNARLWEGLRFLRSVAADDDRWQTRTSHVHRERGVSFAVRGNLIILAPPLVIGDNELERALDIMDALLAELDFT
jgi:4-aminobutyrate aminotransferase-like enzyme